MLYSSTFTRVVSNPKVKHLGVLVSIQAKGAFRAVRASILEGIRYLEASLILVRSDTELHLMRMLI